MFQQNETAINGMSVVSLEIENTFIQGEIVTGHLSTLI